MNVWLRILCKYTTSTKLHASLGCLGRKSTPARIFEVASIGLLIFNCTQYIIHVYNSARMTHCSPSLRTTRFILLHGANFGRLSASCLIPPSRSDAKPKVKGHCSAPHDQYYNLTAQ